MTGSFIIFGIVFPWLVVALVVALGAWISFQLVQQNGRMLGRLESLERRLTALQSATGLPQPMPNPAPAAAPPAPSGLPVGSAAPVFELPDLEGQRKRLDDFRGKKLLLVFFNPRC